MEPIRKSEAGFSLIEIMAALSIAVLMVLSLHTSILSSLKQRERADFHERVRTIAYEYVQTLLSLPFGASTGGAATPSQLQELFDLDDDVGSATLKQVETAIGDPGHSFSLTTEGVEVQFQVVVHADLDSDGDGTGFRESREDLLQIEVFAANRLLFRTIRAADFENTVKD